MKRIALPRPLDNEPFRVATALRRGVPYARLFSSDLERPHHGLRVCRPATALHTRCRQLMPLLAHGDCFGHLTAAEIWGLPMPFALRNGPLHVIAAGRRAMRRPGIIGHEVAASNRAFVVGGVPVVDPLLAWTQCAALLELDALVTMGDALAGRWSPHGAARERDPTELAAAVAAWGARRGARRLREALSLVRPNVWSPKETELRLLLQRAGLPEPVLNMPVLNEPALIDPKGPQDARGHEAGTPDLKWPAHRVAVEYEGDGHRADRAQWRRDVSRYEGFADAGWRVVRVTDDDLASPSILLARLGRLLTLTQRPP